MDNREKIMQCAEELFYSRGYDAAGVQEIVERAGVTKPTLYYYFGSKRGLLEAILETKAVGLWKNIREETKKPGDIRSKLHALAEALYQFFMTQRKFYMLLMALFYSARENEAYQTVRPYLMEFYRSVVQLFEHASGELGNMRGRQEQFAISFIGAIHQYLVMAWDQGILERDGGVQMEELVNQFLYGIFS